MARALFYTAFVANLILTVWSTGTGSRCGPCEHWEECPNLCVPRTCSQLGFRIFCPRHDPKNCMTKPGCVCDDDYVRNDKGFCIPKKDCPSCGDDVNAVSGCGNCVKTCEQYHKNESIGCPQVCYPNACDCRKGYYYDTVTNKCALPENCTPTCGPNEEYEECPFCGPKTCAEVGYHVSCPTNADGSCPYKAGCYCIDGYVRNDKGKCIPIKECPSCHGDVNAVSGCGNCVKTCEQYYKNETIICPQVCYPDACDCRKGYYYDTVTKKCALPENCTLTCGPNEEYEECPFCGPKTCAEVGYNVSCPTNADGSCPYKAGCYCIDGYVRNDKGKCIPIKECPSCHGDVNAVSGCGNCVKTCEQYYKNETIICPQVCYPNACDCRKGYYYDTVTKKCALPENCTPTCGPNEEYEECPFCGPKTCAEVGYHVSCPTNADGSCPYKAGCYCIDGYVRNDKGKCIPIKECPSCHGDVNAVSGCGNCVKTCEQYYKNETIICPQVCYPDACDCRKGYYYDTVTKKCALPENCTLTCGPNEEYEECPFCGPKTCAEVGYNVSCPTNADGSCPYKAGCYCIDGYVRNDKGKCIPIKECPSCHGDVNAVSGCGNCVKTCEQYYKNETIICPQVCYPNACDCRKGYYYDTVTKKCALPENCTPTCGPNEEYEECPFCGPKTCAEVGYHVSCPTNADGSCPYKAGCYCIDGYVRNDKGKCIPIKECPSCHGDVNAVSGCGNCVKTCEQYYKNETIICPQVCYPDACDCRKGYYYDTVTKKCALPENCTLTCGPNEEYEECPFCGPKTCAEVGYNVSCPTNADGSCPYKAGCYCIDGYVRNDKGKCIPIKECPSCHGDVNAVSGCGNCVKTCEQYYKNETIICPQVCYPNACDCRKGYYYDTVTKKCALPENCTPTCGPNEEYEECPFCGPKTCAEVGYHVSCPTNADGSCPYKAGCYCIDGYVRNDKGKCIPIKECPSCHGDVNAVSGCGNCVKTCEQYYKNESIICPQVCYPNACDCRKGYYYDTVTKKCALPENCTLTCGPNEEYEEYPVCGPKTCAEVGYPVSCPYKAGCYCIDGYVRNDKGKCIPIKECPSCHGDVNAVSGCGNCVKTCEQYHKNESIACAQICYPNACDCRKGYYYDTVTKKCALPENCTPICGPDEVYDPCSNGGCHTGRTCEDYYTLNGNTICVDPITCIPGCLCQEGLYRNKYGVCVQPQECPTSCGPNEEFDSCVNGRCHGPVTCRDLDTYNGTTICDNPKKCEAGCACKYGFLRNDKGYCIPENKCPNSKCKGDYETYVPCNYECLPETCDQLGFPQKCLYLSSYEKSCPGKPACLCIAGYVKDKYGKCIPKDQCPACGGDPNAKSGCGAHCNRRCSNYFKPPRPCPLSCIMNGCDCKDKYVYDDNTKRCVLPEKCTPTCGQNEKYTSCVENYPEYRCGISATAKASTRCTPGCICQDGYYRNSNGVCVPKNECPLNDKCAGKPYEFWDTCPPNCVGETCDSIGKVIDCPPQTAVCRPRCRCAQGYYRNSKGVCVAEKQCYQCGKNEVYDKCVSNCPPRTCGINDAAVQCLAIEPADCKGGCRCADGFYRNKKGECVAWEDCPPENPCKNDNEVYDKCPAKCPPRVCGIDDRLIDCAPQPLPGDPKCPPPRCRCANGYYRDDKGKCVKWENCPKCPKGEIYDPCPNPCPAQLCSVDERLIKCAAPPKLGDPECVPGCRCPNGYKRNDDGICIPKEQCPQYCRGANEVWDKCPDPCDPNTCESIDMKYNCPLNGAKKCKGACRCKPGYYRNKLGDCISKEQCLKCRKPHEYYSCGGACDNVCSNLSQQNQTCCPIINIKCNEMCYCEEGYARDRQGYCVPISECRRCKGEHEWYDTCPSNCPPSDSCDTYGKTYRCPLQTIPRKCGRPACRCEDNYLRDEHGVCIPQEQCHQCGKNEVYDKCVSNCPPRTCGINDAAVQCRAIEPADCKGGCRCADGFYRNKKGECVAWEDCPPENPCKNDNEVYDKCPAKCPPRVCGIDDRLIDCAPQPLPGDPKCPPPRCRCANGYYRDDKGKCVKWENCPKCPKGEIYDPCPNPCPAQLCSVDERLIRCKAPPQLGDPECVPGCRCPDGYKRNDDGICIPKEQCPQNCHGANEVWVKCPDPCDPNTCESIDMKYTCPLDGAKKCKGACRCKPGYYRNKLGDCITKEQCLKCRKPHEYYSCGGACDNVCSNLSQQNQTWCPIINIKCNEMCYCEEGYARDRQGYCVPISECRRCKGEHEWYDTCPSNCPPSDSCDTYGKTYRCPLQTIPPKCGKPTCRCEDNYLRDEHGVCIPQEQCSCKGDKNAKPGCGCNRTCSDYHARRPPTCTKECKPDGCECKEGYVLDESCGQCVLPKDCPPPKCPKHEVWNTCPVTCPPETCPDGRVYKCLAPPEPGSPECKPRCQCEKGYYRNQKGICIPKEQCPPW